MRESLTILACCLVAALTAALVGPWFVDWTAQRPWVEAQLSAALGRSVRTSGSIDLVLLPTPRLELGGVAFAPASGASLQSGAVRLELAVMPLLRGEFRFLEASIDEPEVTVAIGAAAAPASVGDTAQDVQFDRIDIRHGRFVLLDAAAGASLTFEGVDLQAEANSLSGPFRGGGTFARGEGRTGFRFTTGVREGDRLRLKLIVDEASGLPKLDLDGALRVAGGPPSFDGNAVLAGRAPVAWRVAGPLKLDLLGAMLEATDLHLGGDDAPVALTGVAKVSFGPNASGDIALTARQIDMDRLLSPKSGSGVEDAMRRLIADAGGPANIPLPLHLSLASPTVTLGGETLSDIALDLRLAPGSPVGLRASGAVPGRSRLSVEGQFETGSAARFAGRAEGEVRDLPRLADWLSPVLPDVAKNLRAFPFRSLDVAGEMELSAAGFAARSLRLKAERSVFTGAAAFTRAIGAEPARLFVDLSSDALDIDTMPDLASAGAALADADISVALDAHAVRVARFGDGMIDAGRIRLKLTKDRAGLKLDSLSISGLGGANVTASGAQGPTGGTLDVRVDAERLVDLAAFLKRVAPGPLADGLASRAVALSPTQLRLKLQAHRNSPQDALQIAGLDLDATARGTHVQASLNPGTAASAASGSALVEARDAPMLIRQVGFDAIPISGSGAGRITATMRGTGDNSFDLDLSGTVAGVSLGLESAVSGPWRQPVATGKLRLSSADAGSLLRLLGYGLPDVTQSLPVEAGSSFRMEGRRLSLTAISGSLAGTALNGTLDADADSGQPKWSGSLDLDRASLPAFAALLLGPQRSARPGVAWDDLRFGAGVSELPDANLVLRIGQLQVIEGLRARQASLRLGLAPNLLNFAEMAGIVGDGRLAGQLSLRRDGANVFLSGAATGQRLAIPGGWADGSLDGHVDFTSTGASPAALVAGLAGTGTGRLENATIGHADPGAPARVIAEADAGNIYISENDFLGALRRELDKGPLVMPTRDFDVQLAAGAARFAAPDLTATVDLRKLSIEARALLGPDTLPKDWSGQTPRLAVTWRGAWNAPQRDLDASAFVNLLATRAISREAARIDMLESDLRERAFFARRQRGLEFLRRREREIAAFVIEEARIADEEKRRSDAARAEHERRAAPPAALPLSIVPLPPPPQQPAGFQAPAANADPSTAGRY